MGDILPPTRFRTVAFWPETAVLMAFSSGKAKNFRVLSQPVPTYDMQRYVAEMLRRSEERTISRLF